MDFNGRKKGKILFCKDTITPPPTTTTKGQKHQSDRRNMILLFPGIIISSFSSSSSLLFLTTLLLFSILVFSPTAKTQFTEAWESQFDSSNILQVRFSSTGVWGTVCDDNFDLASAKGVCRMMNANLNPTNIWRFNRDGTSSAGIDPSKTSGLPIWMNNLNCSRATQAGSVESQCTFVTAYPQTVETCSHAEDVGLFCHPWTMQLDLTSKLLRVRPGRTSNPLQTPLGTVCNSGGTPPSRATALALCKMVGFESTATLEYSKAWFATPGSASSSVPVYLRNIDNCPSQAPREGFSEITLEQCDMEYLPALTGPNTGCNGHETDIALTCQKQTTYRHPGNPSWQIDIASSETSGNAVRLRPNETAPWGTICADRMSTSTATSICRMYNQGPIGNNRLDMGKVYASWTTSATSQHMGAGEIYIDELECDAGATSLGACSYVYSDLGQRRHDCDHSEDTVVFCDEWVFAEEPRTRRLLARPSQSATTSGTICGDGFGINEARAICRFLGYTNGIDKVNFALYGSGASSSGGGENPNSRPVYMSTMSCPADATSLSQCTFRRNADPTSLTDARGLAAGCTHAFDVKIDCNGTSVIPPPASPGFFTSEIILAVFAPLVIVIFIVIFIVVRYFTKQKEAKREKEMMMAGQRSPGSQALSGMTSAVNAPMHDHHHHHHRPGSSFSPQTVRGYGSRKQQQQQQEADQDSFNLDPIPTSTSAIAMTRKNNQENNKKGSPHFEEYESSFGKSNNNNNNSTSDPPASNSMRGGGVQRPLPPQAGSAISVNPFGRSTPSALTGGGKSRNADYADL